MELDWRVTIDTSGMVFKTTTSLPLSLAAAVVGRPLSDIIDDSRKKLLFIHGAIIERAEVTDEGTIFNLSMANAAAGCKLTS